MQLQHAPALQRAATRRVACTCTRPLLTRLNQRGIGALHAAATERSSEATDTESLSTIHAASAAEGQLASKAASRRQQRKREQLTYQVSAIAASIGVSSLAVLATYYKFSYQLQQADGPFPWLEMGGTLALVFGGVVGMEMWARWAHKVLWHDFVPGWALHKSHHEARVGPFEANDLYAIINALPAISLCLYGFTTPGLTGGLAFGAGLGITLFGVMYMFVHDGLVHKRFPVGPIANLPYLRRVAVAHKLHHSERYGGTPWGLFLGPQELEAIGAGPELDAMLAEAEAK